MRPKKVVLLVSADDVQLSRWAFLLETRGYRVMRRDSAGAAVELLRTTIPGKIDCLVTELELGDVDGNALVAMAKLLHEDLSTIILSRASVDDYSSAASVFMPQGKYSPAELLEWVRLLTLRKRGPKKQCRRVEATEMAMKGAA